MSEPKEKTVGSSELHLPPDAVSHHMTARVLHSSRKSLREMAERLADKYEEAKEKQEDIMNRSVDHEASSSLLAQDCQCSHTYRVE